MSSSHTERYLAMTYRVGGGLKNEELKNFFKKLEHRQKGHPQMSCARPRGLAYTKRHSQIFKNTPFNVKVVVGSLMTAPAFRALYLTDFPRRSNTLRSSRNCLPLPRGCQLRSTQASSRKVAQSRPRPKKVSKELLQIFLQT